MERSATEILERNRDVEHIMLASCQYGLHGLGRENFQKQFAMLVTTDVHGCGKQFQSAIEYLNYEKQTVLYFPSTAMDTWQNYDTELNKV